MRGLHSAMSRFGAAMALVLGILPAYPATAMTQPSCVIADVTLNAAHTRLDLVIRHPAGRDSIRFGHLRGPLQRQKLWRLHAAYAHWNGETLHWSRYGPIAVRTSMDVRRQPPRPDRTYRPFIRFDDGSIGFYSALLQTAAGQPALCVHYHAPRGDVVIAPGVTAVDQDVAAPADAPAGYVVFGHPRRVNYADGQLLLDRKLPAWIGRELAHDLPRIVNTYRRGMGIRVVPNVIVYGQAKAPATLDFNGDRLPGTITLGLIGHGWRKASPASRETLVGYAAHELFHVWNTAATKDGLLAREGGADMARIFEEHALLGHPDVAEAVSDAFNACLMEFPEKGLPAALAGPTPGHLPYDCGVPMMLALTYFETADGDDLYIERHYLDLWRRDLQLHALTKYVADDWRILLPWIDNPQIINGDLSRAANARTRESYRQAMTAALEQGDVSVHMVKQPSPNQAIALTRPLMASLMAQDCGGRIGFRTQHDGFRLDHALAPCHSLHADAVVTSIDGYAVSGHAVYALFKSVRANCHARRPVRIGYADGIKASAVACQRAPAMPLQLVQLQTPPLMH